jgi:c-di-GMP-binding flagellar brake protein YcgR
MPKPVVSKSKSGVERRRFRRESLQLGLKFRALKKNAISKPQTSKSGDLSAGGLSMVCNRPLEPDQLLLVTLFIPTAAVVAPGSKPTQSGEMATVLSRVAWCQPTSNDDYFRLGIQFLDLAREDRQRLKSFLVEKKLDHKNSRLYT